MKTLEELIRTKVALGRESNTGFHVVKCRVCNDYKIRAGFKFSNGEVGTSCFNCGANAVFVEGSNTISKKFREILHAYDISDAEINEVLGRSFFSSQNKEPEVITLESIRKLSCKTPEVELPPNSYLLESPEVSRLTQNSVYKYLYDRNLHHSQRPFYYSTDERFANRLIIPFYRNNKLIYWQARAIDDTEPRYLNCETPKDAVIYGYDELTRWSQLPLFVTEGVFDAIPIDGISIIGSRLNECKLELLSKSNRELIFVIDPDKNGKSLGFTALENGWKITFTTENSIDVSKSIQLYGKLFTIATLMKNIPSGRLEAELKLNMLCKINKQVKTR